MKWELIKMNLADKALDKDDPFQQTKVIQKNKNLLPKKNDIFLKWKTTGLLWPG